MLTVFFTALSILAMTSPLWLIAVFAVIREREFDQHIKEHDEQFVRYMKQHDEQFVRYMKQQFNANVEWDESTGSWRKLS